MISASPANAGDILRGGVTPGSGRKNADARQNAGAAAAGIAKATAQDRLARTTKAVNDMRALQAAARAATGGGSVPDGLVPGGLERLQGGTWTGANAPVQSGANVNITQIKSQALLDWKTFNVGGNTTVHFDQTAGGADTGKWIAFNKVFDPSGKPSQIRGQIKADGQVYIINQNGIVFGAGSQVNARTLVASSLPINDRLVEQGLLNNKDAQFLFSALDVPAGSDGTKDFTPTTPLTASGANGEVVVEAGATLSGPVNADGNGGRVMLVGANVRNEGTISTPSGQTILAAGLQVGVQAHDSTDPSLRGLDVWIGDVGKYAGTATNSGIIEAYTGSVLMAGKEVNQMGVIDSSTSVSLNGRIDLIASYGAVGNPNYDNNRAEPIFISQFTGPVTFGAKSVTRVLPDYASTATVPGTSLPENSQLNVQGLSIAMLGTATLLAPHADVTFKAGKWTYLDIDNNRTTFLADGKTPEGGLSLNFDSAGQIFIYSGGQVYLDSGSLLDVSGTTDVFVPLSHNVMTVQLRGTELADSPVQRDSVIRGKELVVDLRKSGINNGAAWVGTPLGDLTSVAGIIERNASQLTATGGTVTMQAGGSIIVQPQAMVDVSGGYYRNEGGRIQTTRLLRNGNLVNIANATPDVIYDGVYEGRTTKTSGKWGVTKTYSNSLAPLGGFTEQENISGANGGSISLTAPSIIIGGDLVGKTITGPRQLDKPADMSSLSFTFQAEARYAATKTDIRFYKTSPVAPQMRVTADPPRLSGVLLSEGENLPKDMTSDFAVSTTWWSSEGGGFGHISVDNRDGEFTQPAGADIYTPAGGSLLVRAANISIGGTISAPGGTVEMTAYNISPYQYQKLGKTNLLLNQPELDANEGRGVITLLGTAKINAAGMQVDDRPASKYSVSTPRALNGGTVSLEGYSINLEAGSCIDASGGALAKTVKGVGKFTYGDGGKVSILAGRDVDLTAITGGTLTLNGSLTAYSANKGGSLTIRANLIQIGGQSSDPTMLVLAPEFFRTGGFTSYSLTGIGKSTKPALTAKEKKDALVNPVPTPTPSTTEDPKEDTYIPAIRMVENTLIEPVAEQLQYVPDNKSDGKLTLSRTLKSQGERKPVSLKFAATGADDSFTREFVEARGDIVIEKGSVIRTDPGASVLIGTDENLTKTLADTVSMEGTIIAPGGTVAIFTRGEFRLAPDIKTKRTYALPTIYIGPNAHISTAGTVVSTPDPFGRRTGVLYSGGTISVRGNIVAEAGATLDVSGGSGVFDIHPSQLDSATATVVPATSGLNSRAYSRRTVATRLDSDGGLLELQGSEMLFSDATLIGRAGGPTAAGGTLSIFSGRYYGPNDSRTSADINLVVNQSDLSLKDTDVKRGVGLKVKYAEKVEVNKVKYVKGDTVPAMGFFAADSFQQGGFASLDLGYKYIEDASPIAYGGNVEFRGPVTISATGSLRVAGGGIIRSDSAVNLAARYIAGGQKYRAPINSSDSAFIAFQQDPADPVAGAQYYPKPSYGTTGEVNFSADLIDIGTTVFETTGKVSFTAANGDIRGDGTLSVAGDITMTAGQIYPTTLGIFNIFAYDYRTIDDTAGKGTVSIVGSGASPMPYSAGGSINIFASKITQGGTLRAPFGSITLGWDGTDFDLSTAVFDSPPNPVVGKALAVPTTESVLLGAGSVTSVSAVDPATGAGLTIPYGISPDGLSWIDPTGINITVNGLPQKRVSIAGNSVTTEVGSVVDIRGGGDLLAYRWVAGTGGSQDLLGDATGTKKQWGEGSSYEAGDLVTYKGKTWSARQAVNPTDFRNSAANSALKSWAKSKDLTANPKDIAATAPPPVAGSTYWTEVQNSYAIVPEYSAPYAPHSVNNTSENAKFLGGDPGFTSTALKLGDQIAIDGGSGLAAGTYTLLPRRYALLPGAFLITPKSRGTFSSFSTRSDALTTSGFSVNSKSSGTFANYTTAEGTPFASGYLLNAFNPSQPSGTRTLFEIAPPTVVADRAKYEVYSANEFMTGAASRLNVDTVQRLPMDSGYLSFQGNNALQIEGSVLASHPEAGRGARVDISSDADMYVIGGSGSAPASSKVTLRGDVLNSWGAESLLIGGLRRTTEDGTVVNVRTPSVTVDNPGASLSSPEITLVSKSALTVTGGSKIVSSGGLTERSETLLLGGDGTLLRVSGDKLTSTIRSSLAGSTKPLMAIGDGAVIAGAGVILDSTYATSLNPMAVLNASYLTLSSGQISIVLDGSDGTLEGSVVNPHMTLQGDLLKRIQSVESLTLSSYRTIDIYGAGTFGSQSLGALNLYASGIRGYNRGTVTLTADQVTLGNPSNSIVLAAPAAPLSGSLKIDAETVKLAANAFTVTGYQNLTIDARKGLLATKTGSLTLPGSLAITAPLITGEKGISYDVTAAGSVSLMRGEEPAAVSGGLGASLGFTGSSVAANTRIHLPSGSLTLHATGGSVTVDSEISVAGSSQTFYDVIRYAGAGSIKLVSDTGSVILSAGSILDVSAHSGGGDAGTIDIRSGFGLFVNEGTLLGSASTGNRGGSFLLDAGSIPSFSSINSPLETGGFTEERNIRVRTGNVIVDGTAHARSFTLSADAGSITVVGKIDASGTTGGSIALAARDSVTIQSGAMLTVAAQTFNSAGKGGEIRIEAGASAGGSPNLAGRVNLLAGSMIDLSVAEFIAGDYTTVESSAFNGQFQGTLHLRAPQITGNTDVGVGSLLGTITGASSVLVEGYRVYTPAGGVMNTTLRTTIDTDSIAFLGAAGAGNANEIAMRTRLLAGAPGAVSLDPILVIAPGAEIVNTAGDLTLGLANQTGSTSAAAAAQAHTVADWDLSTFRYGSKRAPGVLTLRASGDLVFNNTLSDGFAPVTATSNNGWSRMWLAALTSIDLKPDGTLYRPINTQSWSYRLTAGADLSSANPASVLSASGLAAGKGSILVGEFYPAVLNSFTSGTAAGSGTLGQTADNIRFVTGQNDTTNRGTRYEVIRTGTGDIDINAGRDVQLRNQFATIYTAGVALPNRTRIFQDNDFVVPIISRSGIGIPSTDGTLGAVQQAYGVWYAMSGGDVSIKAQANIGRYTTAFTPAGLPTGAPIADTSRQIPTNWLYRRGYVDSTGNFGVSGVQSTGGPGTVTDASASTTWWIDYSNFFQGIGTLGGGDITMIAGDDIINADAVIPTNARMVGRDSVNVAPDSDNLLEHGGGDLVVRAGRNISGGSFYVERGSGTLFAAGDITTNSARTMSKGILAGSTPDLQDALTWMPTTLYVGDSWFDVTARGNVLLGPVTNPFLLPQGMNNRYWYKTQFNTFSPTAGASVTSYGGSVTHRLNVTLKDQGDQSSPVLFNWTSTQNLQSPSNSANVQPWLRLAESSVVNYKAMFSVNAPNLLSTSFAGDINIVGDLTLFPSATGTLELLAAGGVPGLQKSGPISDAPGAPQIWTSATISLSDANPLSIPGITSPLAFQKVVNNSRSETLLLSNANPVATIETYFIETGAIEGADASVSKQNALHASIPLHRNDPQPLRIYSLGGDITGLTLYSPKQSYILASKDINDIAFYLQNANEKSVSVVSAGRDVLLFNENSPLRGTAKDKGDLIDSSDRKETTNGLTSALAGDIQISGPGTLEVLAGRNLDLGTGSNFKVGGLGKGITSIGNFRNPFLPFEGASIVAMAGVQGLNGGAALGLVGSNLDFTATSLMGTSKQTYDTQEHEYLGGLDAFFKTLQQAGTESETTGSYATGFAAIDSLFGGVTGSGEIFTRARDIRTATGGAITIAAPSGGLTMASDIFGNPDTPPGIVTEYGGEVSIFTDGNVDIGRTRIFTLRGGDMTIWSSTGDIAAGTSPKTVVTAPPTRVVIDAASADVSTDLGGLATGGGIGVLASVQGVPKSNVYLIAPVGTVDAGDAGIQATGDIKIAAAAVLNADNISAGGTSTGVPSAPTVAAPNVSGLTSGSSSTAATSNAAESVANQGAKQSQEIVESPSIITVEILGYGGGEDDGG